MILRRVIDHVKAQHWTAVFLDFVIVVAGILIAFQITAWSETSREHQRSAEYLSRIRADLAADMAELNTHQSFWREVAEEGYKAIHYAETGETAGATDWEILRAFLNASQAWQFTFIDSTYSELRSAGELNLIPDPDMRSALADYYVLVAARRGGLGPYNLLPAYREKIRGRTPSQIMRYYWRACFEQGPGVQVFIDCPPPENAPDLKAVIDGYAADQQILDDLRYWTDTQTMALDLADFDLGRAQSLIDQVDKMK
ncbi:MAG: hypothetical protein R3C40_11445 [Parvularculaceae bacterium]